MDVMKKTPENSRKRGFALVVTLSLMILLTVIAVGLLTLSGISLRSSAQGMAQATARSNARLAMMIAIGAMQKSLGPDQQISANASSVAATASQPNILGAWGSLGWQGPAGDTPLPAQKQAKFETWLVSTRNPTAAMTFDFATKPVTGDSVWLYNPVTTGTIAPNDTTLKVELVKLAFGNKVGGMAWGVSDNSTKASLNIRNIEADDLAGNISNRTAAPAPHPEVLSEVFKSISEPGDIISLRTAEIPIGESNAKEITARAQALTGSSLGLLTNPVTGGLKTDLTPLMEGTGSSDLLEAFGSDYVYFPPAGSAVGSGAPTWKYLRNHYQLHKRIKSQTAGTPRVVLASGDLKTVKPGELGLDDKPDTERLLPVIAKLQIIFSLVSHHSHVGARLQALGTQPTLPEDKGNLKHAVPHLVYDPVITLYNPYDVELEVSQLRIRVSDPPVGFQFQKHDLATGTHAWLRDEFAAGEFHGLGRFQRKQEHDVNARKTFTLFMRDLNRGKPGAKLVLLPGEVKVFTPWVESNWTWSLEIGTGDYSPRSFFDFETDNNMGNIDKRTSNKKGVETIPGLDYRAGLQTDHLSYESGRPANSKYAWELPPVMGAGWVSMKLSDEVTVNAKPQRCVADANLPDFRIDVMAGTRDDAESDILRTFEFRMNDVATEMSTITNPAKTISRNFQIGNILQTTTDPTAGGKSPFAIFTMSAKTTKGTRDDSKAWALNNMVTEGGSQQSAKIGNAAQSYDLRLEEIQDFTSFPGVEYDDANKRGYFGAIANASRGVSIVPMYRVPLTPAASLGDWIGSNLVASSQLPRVNYALGNSFANPLLPAGDIKAASPMSDGTNVLDHSFLMNSVLWDSTFFSSAADYRTASFTDKRARSAVLSDFFSGEKPMLNSRLVPYGTGSGGVSQLASDINGKSDLKFSREFAENAMINGAFNINSDSVDAWRAVLSSMRDASVKGYMNQLYETTDKTAFVRTGLPLASSADDANPANSVSALGQIRWAGYRTLTDNQIKNLATLIVAEIRERGRKDKAPSLCLADFINRRLGSAGELHVQKGILQTAIDKSDINAAFHTLDSNDVDGPSLANDRIKGLANTAALDGKSGDGAAPMLTQGDLLTGLAPVITARGDTFTIRAYGEARNSSGTAIEARAWCEVTVQRVPEYIDPVDKPSALQAELTEMNRQFGRRLIITSFRWMNSSEI